MATFLIEVHMADAGALELERAMRMLAAAQTRMRRQSFGRTLFAGLSREDGRFVCLVEAADLESARRMLGLALLPPGRIREIVYLADPDLLGDPPPGGDSLA